jgi:isopentenyl diphosphate isomerase/L-lactate dehydrogenase-like FMN-dependent dehydrogenase
VFALGLAGEHGVRSLLRYYQAELEQTMFLSGCLSVADLQSERLQAQTE